MKQVIIIAFLSYMALSCNNSESASRHQPVKAYFWTNTEPGINHFLYIDGKSNGVVPYLPDSITTPGNKVVMEKGLLIEVPSGRYDLVVSDKEGNITSKGKLTIHISSSNKTLSSSWNNDKCKVQVIYE